MTSDILGDGWNISAQGVNIITEDATLKEKSKILRKALDSDLKEIGDPCLAKEVEKGTISRVVVQIQKIRNISAPKANEQSQTAPRMLKLVLTDGDAYVQAIETAPIASISLEKTPPGSKLLVTAAPISSGYILLNSKNCILLGGQVPALCEKWELSKSVRLQHNKQKTTDGAPAWVNFGGRVSSNGVDNQFKSLDNKTKDSDKDNSEFEQLRKDAIAEATSGAVKKVFGGGTKQSVQNAALYGNKKYSEQQSRESASFNREPRKNFRTKTSVDTVDEADDKPVKPLEKVSLFDFLEDKLVATGVPLNTVQQKEPERTHFDVRSSYANSRPSSNSQYNNRGKYSNTKAPTSQQKPEFNKNNFPKFENTKSSSYNRYPEQSVNGSSAERTSSNNSQFSNSRSSYNNTYPERSNTQNFTNEPSASAAKEFGNKSHFKNNSYSRFDSKQNFVNEPPSGDAMRQETSSANSQFRNNNYSKFDSKQNFVNEPPSSGASMVKESSSTNNQFRNANYSKFDSKQNFVNEPKSGGSTGEETSSTNNQFRNTSYSKFDNKRSSQDNFNQPEQDKQNTVNALDSTMEKMSLNNTQHPNASNNVQFSGSSSNNSQFASRSLRQHLNLGSAPSPRKIDHPFNNEHDSSASQCGNENYTWNWKVGDDCMAKYWEDGKYYNANVTALTDKTCVVKFKDYGNMEEILKTDCLPVSTDNSFRKPYHNGSMEFRRSARAYRK